MPITKPLAENEHLFTSESVTEGHPDKVSDQISAAVLDAIMAEDPEGRVACETRVEDADDELLIAGAGDQGMMFGYASNETEALMPMPIHIAHRLAERLAAVRKDGTLGYLGPDGKTQVSVRYAEGRPVSIDKLLISTQHDEGVDSQSQIRPDLWEHVVLPVLASEV